MKEKKHTGPTELRESAGERANSLTDRTLTEPLGMKTLDVQGEAMAKHSGNPLVSVIIPTYNRAWALGKAVRSVFEQTYRPIECLIIDDGSTDDTSDIVKHLARECPEGVDIRYFLQENGGPNSARNRGLLECRGDFICYLDSDDRLTRDSIKERARILMEELDVDLCYGIASIRDENGVETGTIGKKWPAFGEAKISCYLFHTSSPLIKRSTCARVGLWRADDLHGQEYEYFARLKYFSSKVYFIDKILSVYVRHKNECIFNKSLSFSHAIFRILLAVKALVLYGKYDNKHERQQLSMEFRHVAKRLFRSGDYSNACTALKESLILKSDVKVLAKWLVLKFMVIIKKCEQIVRQ